jgi:glycosyltransferase involved in cell wall biosynthesis
MTVPAKWVTACIPTFRCTTYLRHAVTSLLNQTYPFLRVIVINDGDPEAPWPAIADIQDPRLIRFNLFENRGPYFSLDVALRATSDPFFLVQDADDWSAPLRVEKLLRLLRRDNSHYAFSALAQFHEGVDGKIVLDSPLASKQPDTAPGMEFKNRIFHHGLFRTDAVKKLGGYFGGFKFGYDMLLTNLLLMVGSVSWTAERLYWRRLRPTSLTRAPETGMTSTSRELLVAEMNSVYRQAYQDYQYFVARRLSGPHLLDRIRWRVLVQRGGTDDRRIKMHAAQLRSGMGAQARLFGIQS